VTTPQLMKEMFNATWKGRSRFGACWRV